MSAIVWKSEQHIHTPVHTTPSVARICLHVCFNRECVLCTAVFPQRPCTCVCHMVSRPSEDCEKHMCKELLKEKLSSGVSSYLSEKVKMKVVQSCLTLCNPMDYTAHGILQARILEWVAFPFSRGSGSYQEGTGKSGSYGMWNHPRGHVCNVFVRPASSCQRRLVFFPNTQIIDK